MNNGEANAAKEQTVFRSPSLGRWLLVLAVLLLPVGYGQAGADHPQLLILNSYHQGEAWSDNEIAGFISELGKHYPNLVPAVEALDTKRFPGADHPHFLKRYLLEKYRKAKFDLILALDNPALDLLVSSGAELFPEVPVVFAGINDYHPGMLAGRTKITGVMQNQDVAGTVKMALTFHPGAQRVLVIHDYTPSGLAMRRESEVDLAAMAGKLDIRYSPDRPFDDLRQELQAMPADGLVLILSYVTDQAGHTFTREESTRLITSLSPVPVYAVHKTCLGFGVVGGILLEGEAHGRQAANIAMRILQGEQPSRIPVAESRSRPFIDYAVFNQLKIPEKLLPADVQVINRPQTLWNRHRAILIPAMAAVTLFLALSVVLVVLVARMRRTERTLRESEANHKLVLAMMQESLSVIDGDGNFLLANATAARNLTGGGSENLIGKNIRQLVPEEQSRHLLAVYRQVLDSGAPMAQEVAVSLPQGERWFYNTLRPLEYGERNVHALLSISLDITERKQAEVERARLQAQLQQAQKLEAIGTLAGGIAHDFNNILGAIVGYSEMIRDDFPPGAPGIHDINQVLKASHRAKDLVKQILAFSRQVDDQKIPMQPAVIVKEAITLLRSSLPATIAIRQDIDPQAGMVLADPTQMHQIVMNLATNAFHAMEVKGGTLTIGLCKKTLSRDDLLSEPDLQPGAFVQLSVKDSGEGILPEIRERIFDPFFTTKEVGKGTGLGLSMVYSIVKSGHGAIACDSRLGEGTEFRILWPALDGDSVPERTATEVIPQGKEHLLFIDDEPMLAELGQAMLERLGYQVTTRTNSLDALVAFQNQPESFDLVITDQTMPGMTGIDLARRILQIRPGMPIILCTGYSSLISEEMAKAAGIKGFAFKPLAKKDLGEMIRKILDGKNTGFPLLAIDGKTATLGKE